MLLVETDSKSSDLILSDFRVNQMIKNKWCLTVFMASFQFLCRGAWAEDNNLPLVSLPSVIDYTEGEGWGGAIGFEFESLAAFHGSNHYRLEIKPEGAIQWRSGKHIFFWEGVDLNHTELGWRGLIQGKWLIEAGARHDIVIPSGRSESASLDLPHRGSEITGFLDAKYSIGSEWENWISGRFSAGSNSYGWQAEVSAGHVLFQGKGNAGTEIIAFSTFGSEDNINTFFGVSELDSDVSGLQQVDLDGGYRSSGLNIVCRSNIAYNLQITAKAGIEFYSNDVKKSDLVSDGSETNADLSVVWKF
jgi:hypothetical protein